MTTALVLAGHGSHITPETAGLVWRHVDALRALGVADEVTATFWKEVPSFHTVFDSLAATDITVVPLFTARGYFTQTVIPAEMGLRGDITERDGRIIRYTRTLPEHPYLGESVRRRIEAAYQTLQADPSKTAVALLGHSTKRNAESRKATEDQVERLREANIAAETIALFLDDEPAIADVYKLTTAPTLIAVPYFLAQGSHTTIDVPRELSLPPGETQAIINGRQVHYTPPVGTDDSLREVIIELARDAGASIHEPGAGSPWAGFPQRGRTDLIEAVQVAGRLQFGQLLLRPTDVRHIDDQHSDDLRELTEPGDLRAAIRENPFRPLATSTDLPRGWQVTIDDSAQFHAVVETIYPSTVADWATGRRGVFQAETFAATIQRQTGMFRDLATLHDDQRAELVTQICANCARHPIWFDGEMGSIPCAEPCNVWLSQAAESN
jgi:sirohydrochlorin cobaltochelatase